MRQVSKKKRTLPPHDHGLWAKALNLPSLQPSWLKNIETYDKQGLINDELFSHLVFMSQLHSFYNRQPWYNFSKRVFDILLAILLFIILAPLLAAVAFLIKITSPGPVLFAQERVGRFCAPFTIYKFRTMNVHAQRAIYMHGNEMNGGLFKMAKDPRITPLGRILRKFSIDELPQIYNVLRSQMSFVGPRPLVPEDSATVPRSDYLRFAVKPGMSGLWQVTIRGSESGRDKLRLDCEYVTRRGWSIDLRILWSTLPVVISGRGAY